MKQDQTIKNIAAQLNMEEAMMKKYVNEHITDLKVKIDSNIHEKNQIWNVINKIQKEVFDKNLEEMFKKDIKKSFSAIEI